MTLDDWNGCLLSSVVRMDVERIAELLQPFIGRGMNETQVTSISTYVDILKKWNTRLNLTAVRSPEDMVTRHFGESLYAARFLLSDAPTGLSVIDVGSGAGFPGIPMKIFAPQISLTLIEAQNKKAVFLREVVRALELKDVNVIGARAESVAESAELVTMRAVERFETALPVAARLVRRGGKLGLMIGERQVVTAQRILGGEWTVSGPVPLSTGRVVALWEGRPV